MLHTLLVALAVVGGIAAFIFLCIFITRRQSKQKKQRLAESYESLLALHEINPDFSQTFEHRIFAFDSNRRIFAFVQNEDSFPWAVIELNDVSECKLWKSGIQISIKNKQNQNAEEHISSIGLLFSYKNGTVIHVPFYTEVLDGIAEKLPLNKATEHWLSRLKAAMSEKGNSRHLQLV